MWLKWYNYIKGMISMWDRVNAQKKKMQSLVINSVSVCQFEMLFYIPTQLEKKNLDFRSESWHCGLDSSMCGWQLKIWEVRKSPREFISIRIWANYSEITSPRLGGFKQQKFSSHSWYVSVVGQLFTFIIQALRLPNSYQRKHDSYSVRGGRTLKGLH